MPDGIGRTSRDGSGTIKHFRMLDVDQAPESPGLYAWYATFRASELDWKTRAEDGEDQSIAGFRRLVKNFAAHHEPNPIGLRGSAPYGGLWQGRLDLKYGSTASGSGATLENGLEELEETMESESGRQALALFLSHATPTFSSPLYIGVADDLRTRLKYHKRKYAEGMQWLADNPDGAEKLQENATSFGLRAASRNIAMENLEVWVVDLSVTPSGSKLQRELRRTAQSAEWLLHRLFSPVLGRR